MKWKNKAIYDTMKSQKVTTLSLYTPRYITSCFFMQGLQGTLQLSLLYLLQEGGSVWDGLKT